MEEYNSNACNTVATGSVGESGPAALLHYEVTGPTSKMMVLRNVESSLCPNTGAIAIMVVNGAPVGHENFTDSGSSIQSEAAPGDNVIVIVHTMPLFNGIQCVRLGELKVELDECELVG